MTEVRFGSALVPENLQPRPWFAANDRRRHDGATGRLLLQARHVAAMSANVSLPSGKGQQLGSSAPLQRARRARCDPQARPGVEGRCSALCASDATSRRRNCRCASRGRLCGTEGQRGLAKRASPQSCMALRRKAASRSAYIWDDAALDAVLVEFSGTVRTSESHEYEFPEPELVRRIVGGVIARMRRGPRRAGSAPYRHWHRGALLPRRMGARAWIPAGSQRSLARSRSDDLLHRGERTADLRRERCVGGRGGGTGLRCGDPLSRLHSPLDQHDDRRRSDH